MCMTAADIHDRIRAIGGKRAYIAADAFRIDHGLHEYSVAFDFADKRVRATGETWAAAMADAERQVPNAFPPTGDFHEGEPMPLEVPHL